MKKVFNFRTVMVTVFAVAVAILAPSCSLIFSDDDRASSSDFGAIRVDFGENSRAYKELNSSTVTKFTVTVSNGTDAPKEQDVVWGGSAEFANLAPGTYTVTADAYMGADVVQSASDTVKVAAGETASAVLNFVKKWYFSNKIVLPIRGDDESVNLFRISVYDSLSEIPSNLQGASYVESFLNSSAEDNDGNVHYAFINDGICYEKKYGDGSYSNSIGSLLQVYFYNDFNTGTLHSFKMVNLTDYELNGTIFLSRSFADDFEGFYSILGFAEEGDNVFLVGNKGEYSDALYYGKIRKDSNSIEKVYEKGIGDIDAEFSNCKIRDIKILEIGKLALIISDVRASSGNNAVICADGDEDPAYSRGALLICSYDDSSIYIDKVIGWYDRSRNLTTKGTFVDESQDDYGNSRETVKPENGNVLTSMKIYGPSKSEAKSYFYGPQRIVCIKPKDLYIADEGINVNLADWTKRDPNGDGMTYYSATQKGLSGNVFVHSRIVRVNLETFGFNVEKDYSQAMFGCMYKDDPDWKYVKKTAEKPWLFKFDFDDESGPYAADNKIGEVSGCSYYLGVHATPVECEE